MVFSVKEECMKQVPWFSLTEWYEVYKQIYSNDTVEQTKACDTLLAWKARMPKLPLGVDCTLSIVQVCLRDREWSPKINNGELPISYENDLSLMYSTTIMRFLNHISNLGHTKHTSLFQIAKQLNIPEWIVNLRHDTAHGHQLPSIGVLRIAINILLTWLHEEYWATEVKRMEQSMVTGESVKEVEETEEIQEFSDLIELWTAVNLYIHAGYNLVSDIPDPRLKETLQDLHLYASSLLEQNNENIENDKDNYRQDATDGIKKDKKYKLVTAKVILLSEISRYLNKKSIPNKKDIVYNALLNSEAFLPSKDILQIFVQKETTVTDLENHILPLDMISFWKDIIFLLYEKEMMETIILELLNLMNNEQVTKDRKLLASLWISSICYSFVKLDAAHCIARTLEYELQVAEKRLPPKTFQLKVKEETDHTYPHLKDVFWFNLSSVVLPCLTDVNFVLKFILNANELSMKFILPMLELTSPKLDEERKQLLLNLINISVTGNTTNDENFTQYQNIFTLKDICNQHDRILDLDNEQNKSKGTTSHFLSDEKVRTQCWKLPSTNYHWVNCPIGLLPWQIDSMQVLNPLKKISQKYNVLALESEITPGIIDSKDLKMKSKINWNNVLRKKKRSKRKYERRNADIIINRALETAKKQK
ncbi:ribosomal biogenesis protein LAS1L [Colletes gigas]|uniref:ribosomal biogenesis protein LAS1L n=1 Tax=Colletes gigas TaxID=935657 RepID=UPI001C9AFB2F|nr:ribosomal biogenesis protein LAS1L [Colletes gigas]